jgi:mRNA degradation ribonuclease J1/J2
MKITKEMFPDYSIVRHTSYGREVDYAQVAFINISERDIVALLNGEILDVVGDLPILIRFQHDDNLSFGGAIAKYMKDFPNSIEF